MKTCKHIFAFDTINRMMATGSTMPVQYQLQKQTRPWYGELLG